MTSDRSLIERAVESGDLAALAEFAELVEGFPAGADPTGHSWLSGAVCTGDIAVVRWMLEAGADPNPRDPDGFTILQLCLDRPRPDRYKIMELLLTAGADPDLRGFNDWTALHHAAVRDDFTAIGLLLDAGADPTVRTRIDDYATAEEEARNLGHLKSADLIRDHDPPQPGSSDARGRPNEQRRD